MAIDSSDAIGQTRRWQGASPRRAFVRCIVSLALAVSPVGFVVPYLVLVYLDICNGALGSGVHCKLSGGLAGYFETWAALWEISCFLMGLCLVWGLAAIATWLAVPYYALRGLSLLIKGAR